MSGGPACPLCGAPGCRPAFRLRGHEIDRCPGCGFLFNAGFRGGGGEGETFSEEYYLVQHGAGFRPQLDDWRRDLSLPVYERRLAELEARLGGRGRLLDVGPGLGTFLRLARERGWRVEGVEISRFAVEHIRRAHGIEVFAGGLDQYPEQPGGFDLVTFWDSLEHVPDPRGDLERARRLLRPGGLLLLTTDNFDCLIADVAAALYRLTGGALAYPVERVFIDRNLAYFTEATLLRLLEEVGFEVVRREKMEYPLGKIVAGPLERLALRLFYAAAAVTRRQAQVTVLAARR